MRERVEDYDTMRCVDLEWWSKEFQTSLNSKLKFMHPFSFLCVYLDNDVERNLDVKK